MTRIPISDRLSPGMEPYSRTPEFDEDDIPPSLLQAHATRRGVWGLIDVVEGRLAYRVTDPRCRPSEQLLTPDAAPGVIAPTIVHQVEPLGPVRFYIEFHSAPDDGAAFKPFG